MSVFNVQIKREKEREAENDRNGKEKLMSMLNSKCSVFGIQRPENENSPLPRQKKNRLLGTTFRHRTLGKHLKH